ncbi:FAD-dependent thymidylate synthase [Patescibacteria group bacterium]
MRKRKYKKLKLQKSYTLRPTNPGAERWLGVVIPVLNHGYVYLLDYLGGDGDIEQAARVSYGEGTRKVSQTGGLIRYLASHSHTSPFEMVEFKFHAKMPIFVARQWVRHRTASLNEYSARYSVLKNEFYVPKSSAISVQSLDNKQGRGNSVNSTIAKKIKDRLSKHYKASNGFYQWLLDENDGPGLARELARITLPLAVYTQWYWKIDLHNLLHFLKLRMDKHAQLEIREYANAIATIVKDAVPFTWEAFNDYKLEALSLNRLEKDVLKKTFSGKEVALDENEINAVAAQVGLNNKRELMEFKDKLRDMGLIKT